MSGSIARGPAMTLAIPYYSGFAFLRDTLASIAAQTHGALSVLVCDDSPEGLSPAQQREIEALCHPFASRLLRNPENLGMAQTWNRCLEESETDLVTIVHADDQLAPSYAAEMAALASAEPEACGLFTGATIIGAEGQPAFSFPDAYKTLLVPRHGARLSLRGDRALASLLRGNYIFCPSLCYRRSQLGALRFDERYRMVLDFDLTSRILLEGKTLVGIPKRPLYRYRRHEQNTTQQLTKELTRFKEESAFYLELAARADACGFPRAAATARQRRIICLNLLFCIVRDACTWEWRDFGRKLALFNELFLARGVA